jgi:predicted DNA-binding transcriptional regulator AlpA
MAKQSENTGQTKLAYSVDEYCAAIGICRASLYNAWRDGRGPRRMKVGHRTFISIEAADDFRRECESDDAA